MPKQTTAVAVTFTLNSSAASPPYNMTNCSGTITYDDGSQSTWGGWNAEDVGTPQSSGASFALNIVDSNYPLNQTVVKNWAVTFIPRGSTTQASPFANNVNTITGTGGTTQTGNTALNLGNVKIKSAGDWDWAVMVQMGFPNGGIHCFGSDPEMDVDA